MAWYRLPVKLPTQDDLSAALWPVPVVLTSSYAQGPSSARCQGYPCSYSRLPRSISSPNGRRRPESVEGYFPLVRSPSLRFVLPKKLSRHGGKVERVGLGTGPFPGN
ncbi:hypothetical protein DFH06DRAFT_1311709 [Mycena polygramma]|nr:hypothetical protein DFH06DRAFT_1311709 [Mycena polygramma]